MSLLRAILLLRPLPRRGSGLAFRASAVAPGTAGRLRQTKAKARPGGEIAPDPGRTRRAAVGGAAAMTGSIGLSAFSFFSQETDKEKETVEGEKETTEEDAIVYLLKKAKLNIMKGELDEAERILHEAARLSHKSENKNAIIYTYDMMANLAFVRGQMEQAEKLFKAAMSFMLAGDTKEDDNAIIEMSLKLTSIYAAQNQHELALAGYQFCILSLEDKMAKWKDLPAETLSEEEKENTSLLLGMSLDSYARYLLANSQAAAAQKMYERALKIATEVQGEKHPQTVVLMSDLATALDSQGRYDEAYAQVRRASELARQTQHPEVHIILNNLAGILMHKEDFAQAKEVYQEALEQAEKTGDGASIRYIQKELVELGRRRRKRLRSQKNGAEPDRA